MTQIVFYRPGVCFRCWLGQRSDRTGPENRTSLSTFCYSSARRRFQWVGVPCECRVALTTEGASSSSLCCRLAPDSRKWLAEVLSERDEIRWSGRFSQRSHLARTSFAFFPESETRICGGSSSSSKISKSKCSGSNNSESNNSNNAMCLFHSMHSSERAHQ